MNTAYSRNMIGYGQTPPNKQIIALQFVINYEEGGETCILHGDQTSETFLSEIIGATPLNELRHIEYGILLGIWQSSRFLASA